MRVGALVAAALLVPSLAIANGRPPLTNGIFFQPSDPKAIYVRATFGLLVSHDDGCTFRWVCEQAIGYTGQFDPKYAAAADGTIFATTYEGLRVSRDSGCTWETATAELPKGDPGRIADVWIDALDIAPNGDVWVATAESARPNNVYRSTDNGRTFAPRGMLSPTIWWKSVKAAPTDAQRVYVTGYQVAGVPLPDGGTAPPIAHFERSDNAGETWTSSPLANVAFGSTPILYVAGVDPTNADVLFLTSAGANPPNGDRLYRSTDGGATFSEVLATSASIHDVVFHRGKVVVATLAGGSFESTDAGATFGPLNNPPQLGCLGARGDELIGCGANWQPDFKAVARSSDGATWDKVFRFVELAGPLKCNAGTTTQEVCDPMWPSLQQQFGATGPTCGAPEPDGPPPTKPEERGGCCDASTGAPIGAIALGGFVAALVLRRRRRCCEG
ncbi:MAG: WD40/YVTN/BNR-like repeat-containing protein [Kofleriaceae bacterium]